MEKGSIVDKLNIFEKEFYELCDKHNVELREVYDISSDDWQIHIWVEGEEVFHITFNEFIS